MRLVDIIKKTAHADFDSFADLLASIDTVEYLISETADIDESDNFAPLTDFDSEKYVEDEAQGISEEVSDVPVMMVGGVKNETRRENGLAGEKDRRREVMSEGAIREVRGVETCSGGLEIKIDGGNLPVRNMLNNQERLEIVETGKEHHKENDSTLTLQSHFSIENKDQSFTKDEDQLSKMEDSQICESAIINPHDINTDSVAQSIEVDKSKPTNEEFLNSIIQKYLGKGPQANSLTTRPPSQMFRSMDAYTSISPYKSYWPDYAKHRQPVSSYLQRQIESGSRESSAEVESKLANDRWSRIDPASYGQTLGMDGRKDGSRPMFSSMTAFMKPDNQFSEANSGIETRKKDAVHQSAVLRLKSSVDLGNKNMSTRVLHQPANSPVLASVGNLSNVQPKPSGVANSSSSTYSKFLNNPYTRIDSGKSPLEESGTWSKVRETPQDLLLGWSAMAGPPKDASRIAIDSIQNKYSQAVKWPIVGYSSANIETSDMNRKAGYLQIETKQGTAISAKIGEHRPAADTTIREKVLKETVIKLPKKPFQYYLDLPKELDRPVGLTSSILSPVKASPIEFSQPNDRIIRSEHQGLERREDDYQSKNVVTSKIKEERGSNEELGYYGHHMKSSLTLGSEESNSKRRNRSVSFNLDNSDLYSTKPYLSKGAVKSILKNKGTIKQGHSKYLEFEKKYSTPTKKQEQGNRDHIYIQGEPPISNIQSRPKNLSLSAISTKNHRQPSTDLAQLHTAYHSGMVASPQNLTVHSVLKGCSPGVVTRVTTYGAKEAPEKFALRHGYCPTSSSFFSSQPIADFRSAFIGIPSAYGTQRLNSSYQQN